MEVINSSGHFSHNVRGCLMKNYNMLYFWILMINRDVMTNAADLCCRRNRRQTEEDLVRDMNEEDLVREAGKV